MKKYLVLLFGVMFFFGCKAQNSVKVLTAEEFAAAVKADKKAVVLDVRRPDEFAAGHIEGAVLLNFLDTVSFNAGVEKLDKSKTYYIYCRSGRRSNNAAVILQKKGFTVFDLGGGFLSWQRYNLPWVK
ncbi:MAG: rhodanese-like domain-containing protein [Candidatus Aphodosoma sp.]